MDVPLVKKASRWQLIQNLALFAIVRRQCVIWRDAVLSCNSPSINGTGYYDAIYFPTFSFFKAVFYITGGVSILWCILWFIFLSDEPRDHKCISEKEINFIETNRSAESIDLDDKHQETKVQVVYPKLFQWSNIFVECVLTFFCK